jgi:hypothetical protein
MLSARAARIMLNNLSGTFVTADDITWLSYTPHYDFPIDFESKWRNVAKVYEKACRLVHDKTKDTFQALVCEPQPVHMADMGSTTIDSSSLFIEINNT